MFWELLYFPCSQQKQCLEADLCGNHSKWEAWTQAAYCLLLTQSLLQKEMWFITGCFREEHVVPFGWLIVWSVRKATFGFAVCKKQLQIWFSGLKMKKQRIATWDVWFLRVQANNGLPTYHWPSKTPGCSAEVQKVPFWEPPVLF